MIDRLAPTRRPLARPVMRQNWRDLLFIHWPINPDALRPLIPAPLELDLFEGTAYIGLIPVYHDRGTADRTSRRPGTFELPRDQCTNVRARGWP